MIISPAVLEEVFASGTVEPPRRSYERLRDQWSRFSLWLNDEARVKQTQAPVHDWLDAVLEDFLGHPAAHWQKGPQVNSRFTSVTSTQERLRPNRVLLRDGQPQLLVLRDESRQLGLGRSRKAQANLARLLRDTECKLGLLTNGVQFRLLYAGLDFEAWCEWNAATWFEEGELRRQLNGFLTLLGPNGFAPRDGYGFPLGDAGQLSRTKQGELAQVLGEQVRTAVEIILAQVDQAARTRPDLLQALQTDPITGAGLAERDWLQALYQAGVRLVMRLVVVLFAEARDLLPRNLESYYHAYSVEGLFAILRAAHAELGNSGLEERRYAWPRIMALCRLVHEGSAHEALPVPAYGGTLFRRGDAGAEDAVLRALAIFENTDFELNDAEVLKVLRLLKIGKVKARRGRSASWVSGPVDFSDLRTEYIGIMYEGLLDYELRRVPEQQGGVVFLAIGQEPALPFSLLESLDDRQLKDLIGKLAKEKDSGPKLSDEDADEDEEAVEAEEEEPVAEEEPEDETPEDDEAEPATDSHSVHQRALDWARHAVEAAGLVKKPRGKAAQLSLHEQELETAARKLIRPHVVAPGEMYLIRSGGTRKGSGTFYTRPQLAVPTTHRTLEPLVFEQHDGQRHPRPPEDILSLKVVDPAMGSGSFLVAALRYLTDALYESLQVHGRLQGQGNTHTVVTLPYGDPSAGELTEELLPVPPEDDRFEFLLKARLKRHIVERCLYGVDINPLAVELARLSLWVETMDRELPFEFLDHKLKVGNSLVGCWLEHFQDYPARAWEREAGDSGKDYAPVHFKKEQITRRIKAIRADTVKPELRSWIEQRGPQQALQFGEQHGTALDVQLAARQTYEHLHQMARDNREEAYRNWQHSPEFLALRAAFDRWCAIWFWPLEDETAPVPTPAHFHSQDPGFVRLTTVLRERHRFFHWELEFPDVFTPERRGFDAVVGNPPWEISKPISKEFFTAHDPIYRMRGKQEALNVQAELFEADPEIERQWLTYCSRFKALSNWVRQSENPFDFPLAGGGALQVKQQWERERARRTGLAQEGPPYRHQGGADLNLYKLMLEVAHHLLRDGGQLGFIVPSGIYTDKGTTALRKLFLEHCQWHWLYGFENREGIFHIHRSFKFCPIIVQRGGQTEAIKAAFMRRKMEEWERTEPATLPVTREQIARFSPHTRSIMELKSRRELEICEKLYAEHPLLGDKGEGKWNVDFVREFDMTGDSKLFPPIGKWLEKGYEPDGYGRWRGPDGDLALPLYEGRMIGQFDFSQKGWVSGKGRTAVWREIPWHEKVIEPQYLMRREVFEENSPIADGPKLAIMDISSATNTRTLISSVVPRSPCGHSITVATADGQSLTSTLGLAAFFDSFAYDHVIRRRVGGLHMSYFYLVETPLPALSDGSARRALIRDAAALMLGHPLFAPDWLRLRAEYPHLGDTPWQELWAIDDAERLRRRCLLDAIVAELYGLDYADLEFIVRIDPGDPTGFWRVDQDLPPEHRHTTLTLHAFRALKEMGLDAFCASDWQLPPEARQFRTARQTYTWTPKETWEDCERHARNMMSEPEWRAFEAELERIRRGEKAEPADATRDQQVLPDMPESEQQRLF
jgi:hypothetical protein